MVRFNTYLNLYFQNGYFNNVQPQPKSAERSSRAVRGGPGERQSVFQPCYSRVVGTIGPWYADELSTCPEGRYLAPPPNTYLCNPRALSPCWPAAAERTAMLKFAHQASVQTSAGVAGPINVPLPA